MTDEEMNVMAGKIGTAMVRAIAETTEDYSNDDSVRLALPAIAKIGGMFLQMVDPDDRGDACALFARMVNEAIEQMDCMDSNMKPGAVIKKARMQ